MCDLWWFPVAPVAGARRDISQLPGETAPGHTVAHPCVAALAFRSFAGDCYRLIPAVQQKGPINLCFRKCQHPKRRSQKVCWRRPSRWLSFRIPPSPVCTAKVIWEYLHLCASYGALRLKGLLCKTVGSHYLYSLAEGKFLGPLCWHEFCSHLQSGPEIDSDRWLTLKYSIQKTKTCIFPSQSQLPRGGRRKHLSSHANRRAFSPPLAV